MTREQTLRHALLVTSGILSKLMERMLISPDARVTFRDDFAHLGTVTLGDALDMADAALADEETE